MNTEKSRTIHGLNIPILFFNLGAALLYKVYLYISLWMLLAEYNVCWCSQLNAPAWIITEQVEGSWWALAMEI